MQFSKPIIFCQLICLYPVLVWHNLELAKLNAAPLLLLCETAKARERGRERVCLWKYQVLDRPLYMADKLYQIVQTYLLCHSESYH